jgi:ELWxxDGT repeat protein
MRLHLLLHTLLLHCLAAAAQPTLLKATGQVDQLTNADGTIYFVRQPSPGQGQLWKSNGTAAGTVLVKEFVGQPYEMTNVNGTLFFVVRGYETRATRFGKAGEPRPPPYP